MVVCMYVYIYMLYAYVSYFTNVHICIMGAQSWDGARTAQNILDLDGNPMFVGIWGPNLSTNSSLELHFQQNRSATPPPQSRWPQDPLAPAAWPLALAWLACHCWGPEFESNGESLMCYHTMKRGGLLGQNASNISVSHSVNGNIYGEPVRLHRFEVGTSRCQGWNTCTHRVGFSFKQACYDAMDYNMDVNSMIIIYTGSTAQGSSGSFKNRKPIGEATDGLKGACNILLDQPHH